MNCIKNAPLKGAENKVSLVGLEPAPTASEAVTLSIALQGRTALFYQRISSQP